MTAALLLVAIGDSITRGFGAHGDPWPVQVAEARGWEVEIVAKAGGTAADLREREVPKADVVVVWLGVNDDRRGVAAEDYRDDLLAIVGKQDAAVYVVIPTGRLREPAEWVAAVSGAFPIHIDGIEDDPAHFSDGVHLSEAGQTWVANRILEALP